MDSTDASETMEKEHMLIKRNQHGFLILDKINKFRFQGKFTDATIVCEGNLYPLHKLMLSSCSSYFTKIFENVPSNNPVVVLSDINSSDFEALLRYIYNGETTIKRDDLMTFMKVAKNLNIDGLSDHDADLHDDLSPSSDNRRNSKRPLTSSQLNTANAEKKLKKYFSPRNISVSPSSPPKKSPESVYSMESSYNNAICMEEDDIKDVSTTEEEIMSSSTTYKASQMEHENKIDEGTPKHNATPNQFFLVTTADRTCTRSICAKNLTQLFATGAKRFKVDKFVSCVMESNGTIIEKEDLSAIPYSSLLMLLKEDQIWENKIDQTLLPSTSSSSFSLVSNKNYFFKKIISSQKFPWPIPFPLPKFDPKIEEELKKENSSCKSDKKLFGSIITSLFEELKKYFPCNKVFPTALQYFSVCYSLVETYPFLKVAGSDEIGIWKRALRRKACLSRENHRKVVGALLEQEEQKIARYEKNIKTELLSDAPSAENISEAIENTLSNRQLKFAGSIKDRPRVFLEEPLYRSIEMIFFEVDLILLRQELSGDSIYEMEEKLDYFIQDNRSVLLTKYKNLRCRRPTQITNDPKLNENFSRTNPIPELAVLLMFLCLNEDPFKVFSNDKELCLTSPFPMIIVDSYVKPVTIEIVMGDKVLLTPGGLYEAVTLWYCVLKILNILPTESLNLIDLLECIANIKEFPSRRNTDRLLKYIAANNGSRSSV